MIESVIATNYLNAGLSVLPADRMLKCPRGKWKEWQTRLPTAEEERAWFANKQDAVCIVCGKVSGNLEVLDFDNKGELFSKWKESIPADLLAKLVIEQTPSGGYHVAYRCADDICGNIKLARGVRDDKTVTLIETRGEGGLVLCAPTEGYTIQNGDYANLPRLTAEERVTLLNTAWQMDEAKHGPQPTQNDMPSGFSLFEPNPSSFEQRPGDDFNLRGDVRGLLEHHGWKSLGIQPDGNEYWRGPGKETDGNSATLKDGVFYVFSSNAAPFEANRGYAPFTVYALLEHNGAYNEAAAKLLECGYGKAASDDGGVNLEPFLNTIRQKEEQQLYTGRELLRQFTEMKPPLIGGLLRREEVMNIVAAPKTGKSWLVMQLALCLVTGREWFGHQCPQSRVLLIDNELHKETIACRLAKVATAMGIPLEDEAIDNLTVFPQRGMAKDLTLLNAKLAEFKNRGFDVIVIDALYKALPAAVDENSNGQITAIYNLLDGYARQMKSAIILVHHTSKGNQANKSVTDLGSGAGAQSRSPDTHLTLRTNEEEGVASVYCCVRSFPPVAPFCLRKSGNNLWELAPDCSPENLDGRASAEPTQLGKMRRTPVEDVADMIVENVHELNLPLSKTLMVEKVREACNTSKDKASAAILYLLNSGYLEERRGDSKSHQQAMKCVYFGPNSPMYEPPVSTKACFRAAQI